MVILNQDLGMMSSYFQRSRFIMVRPHHPGNVGSAARAIKTMGFSDLTLVHSDSTPLLQDPQAIALSSSAQDILQQAQTYPTLKEALEPITLSFALTARPRDMGPKVVDIRQATRLARSHLTQNDQHRVAIVLGTERSGLSNEDISHCHAICHIPANPEYSSLNVAQALQLAAWELRYALLEEAIVHEFERLNQPKEVGDEPAPLGQVEALLVHWQQALEAIRFLNPTHPKKLMLRMRYWFIRSRMTQDETDMMRGVCTQILRHIKRTS